MSHNAHLGSPRKAMMVRLIPLVSPQKITAVGTAGRLVAPRSEPTLTQTADPVATQPAPAQTVTTQMDSGRQDRQEESKPTVVRMAPVVTSSDMQNFSGVVTVEITVGTQGELIQALILTSTPQGVYDNAVLSALAASEFRAGRNHTGPVQGTVRLQFDFGADQMAPAQAP